MKIAVLCLPGIGDSLMATPLISKLRKTYPNATIDIVCMFDGVAYCFKNNPAVNHVYRLSLYNVPLWKGLSEIFSLRRKNRYDISFLAFPAYRREYHIVQYLLGAKKRISHVFAKGFFKECNFFDTDRVSVDESVHNVINNLRLMNVISKQKNTDTLKLTYTLFLDKKDIQFGKKYISQLGWDKKTIIGIHPGSMDSEAGLQKRWSFENYISVAKELMKMHKKVIFFIGPSEKNIDVHEIRPYKRNKDFVIVENATFGESLGVLNQVTIFLSNDNGYAHLANALSIKGIILYGPTNPLWCIPINTSCSRAIRKASFTPWFRNDMKVTSPPKGIENGMNKISVLDVVKTIKKELN